ncbi:hypothetical protein [uncultured Nonlabens sp.]|uniref:hypothetical protein n=1 Tax=uncultured Nonlabens sp. TaxID=859306 RepID=UPI0030DBD1BC|tara:strand:- start:104 stop:511 length:408 start_codon:yes stop_codon:yes gene_type:complete
MDTLKLNPKAQYLLGAALDVLHYENTEWLHTIAFWKDEIRFFENLLKSKEASGKNQADYKKMLRNLDSIYKDLFKDLEKSVVQHEKLLSEIDQGLNGISDANYREQHQHIFLKIDSFTTNFNIFKKIVFNYVKGL